MNWLNSVRLAIVVMSDDFVVNFVMCKFYCEASKQDICETCIKL